MSNPPGVSTAFFWRDSTSALPPREATNDANNGANDGNGRHVTATVSAWRGCTTL